MTHYSSGKSNRSYDYGVLDVAAVVVVAKDRG